MKTFILTTAAGCLLSGCALTETGSTHRTNSGATVYGLNDQPQTSVAGNGSLMPGAFGSREIPTGQFTGRERTPDQIGQQPLLPREADGSQLVRNGPAGLGTGAGTLGQAGILPNRPVSNDTIMEEPGVPSGAPAHAAVLPPNGIPIEENDSVGGPAEIERGSERSKVKP